MRRLPSIALALIVVSGCASAPRYPSEFPSTPPPPPPPGGGVLQDWRGVITAADRGRYDRLDDAWSIALDQARSRPGSGDLAGVGALLQADLALSEAVPPTGDYRCRTVKLGSQSADGLGYVVYDWFRCRIERTPRGLKFSKLTGSQRQAGLLFPESDRRMVLLGSLSLGDEPAANSYGQNPDRDLVGVLERIGESRWRIAIPWPQAESNLDLLELVPA